MNNSVELDISRIDVDSLAPFYNLLADKKNLQITNIQKSGPASLIYTIKQENNQFLFAIVIDGTGELVYKGKRKKIEKNDYFYYEQLEDLVRVDVHKKINILVVTTMKTFQESKENHEVLQELMEKIEEKDHYTLGHCYRVSKLVSGIASKLKYYNKDLFILFYAAYFHDVGKIEIEDKILNKSSCLNEKEFLEMRQHVIYSSHIFSEKFTSLERFFDKELIAEVILQHHERLDGTGYPKGLKENEILLDAKIIAICDSFDAMVTDRPYKKGKSKESALEELKELSGIHYDKKIVQLFEEVIKERFDELYLSET